MDFVSVTKITNCQVKHVYCMSLFCRIHIIIIIIISISISIISITRIRILRILETEQCLEKKDRQNKKLHCLWDVVNGNEENSWLLGVLPIQYRFQVCMSK